MARNDLRARGREAPHQQLVYIYIYIYIYIYLYIYMFIYKGPSLIASAAKGENLEILSLA